YGDADDDGKITANDASLVLTEYAALSAGKAAFTAKQTALADVDGDGKITANDASNILMFYAYLSGNGTETDIKIWLNNLS
ncbi:MAG TPA: dockerin type I domain-containing protein, partial [Ruminococcus sp.]